MNKTFLSFNWRKRKWNKVKAKKELVATRHNAREREERERIQLLITSWSEPPTQSRAKQEDNAASVRLRQHEELSSKVFLTFEDISRFAQPLDSRELRATQKPSSKNKSKKNKKAIKVSQRAKLRVIKIEVFSCVPHSQKRLNSRAAERKRTY
jgi:hypothetical protein